MSSTSSSSLDLTTLRSRAEQLRSGANEMALIQESWRKVADLPTLDDAQTAFIVLLRDTADDFDRLLTFAEGVTRQLEGAERTVESIATMLGWGNVPPRATLEREINALKRRLQDALSDAEAAEAHCVTLQQQLDELRELNEANHG